MGDATLSRFWVPLLDAVPPVAGNHLHAAFTAWFDESESDTPGGGGSGLTRHGGPAACGHSARPKPYALSPLTDGADGPGIFLSVVSSDAWDALAWHAQRVATVDLGGRPCRIGRLELVEQVSWDRLRRGDGARAWLIEFLTPTVFRTNNRHSPLPSLASMVRSPAEVWERYGPLPSVQVSLPPGTAWVSELDLRSVPFQTTARPAQRGARGKISVPSSVVGVLGRLLLHCEDADRAASLGALLDLANYTGIGSYRARGMGVVHVRSVR